MNSSIQRRWAMATGCSLALWVGFAEGTQAASAPSDFSSASSVDPCFVRALPRVKQAAGLSETNSAWVFPEWKPGLCMLIGFRTDVESRQFVHLVEVTTLDPAKAGSMGQPIVLPVTRRSVAFGQTNQPEAKPRVHTFTSAKYPVRVRLFDAEGGLLMEGREQLPWSFLTNGLVDVCDALRPQKLADNPAGIVLAPGPGPGTTRATGRALELSPELEARIARGRLALGGLFAVIGRSRALEPVREHAIAVVRPPSLWRAVMDLKLDLRLDPRFGQALELPSLEGGRTERRLGFPLFLLQGQRTLTTVDFVAGSTEGAYFLTSGVRAFRATHPTKPGRRLLAQVLAVGMARH